MSNVAYTELFNPKMPVSFAKHTVPGIAAIQALMAVLLLEKASFSWYFVSSLTINFACYAFYSIVVYPRWFSPLRHLPRPRVSTVVPSNVNMLILIIIPISQGGNLILGHALAEFKMPRGNEYLRFTNETANTGIIHLHGLFGSEQLLLTGLAALNEALVQRPYDFEWPDGDRDFLRRILGRGLITAEGQVHKQQRKQMAHSFGIKYIKGLYPLFWKKSIDLVKGITGELSQGCSERDGSSLISGETDVCSWAQRVSLDIIGEAGFGWQFNTLHNPDNELAKNFEQIFAPTIENALLFAISVYGPGWALEYVPGGISKRFIAATAEVRDVCRAFIRRKTTQADASNDILSQLITQEGVSEDLLVDQTLTFLTAG